MFSLQAVQLPSTLIPEEFHLVKNQGTKNLEFKDEYVFLQNSSNTVVFIKKIQVLGKNSILSKYFNFQ